MVDGFLEDYGVLYFIFREVNVECKPIISLFAKPALSFGLICKCVSYESAIKGHFHLLNDLTDVHRFPCANIKYTAEVGFICTACVTLFSSWLNRCRPTGPLRNDFDRWPLSEKPVSYRLVETQRESHSLCGEFGPIR